MKAQQYKQTNLLLLLAINAKLHKMLITIYNYSMLSDSYKMEKSETKWQFLSNEAGSIGTKS